MNWVEVSTGMAGLN